MENTQRVTIQLQKWGPSIWMLGSSARESKVYLTFANPGPVEIDFATLSLTEQNHLVEGVIRDHISCSCSTEELRAWYMKAQGREVSMSNSPESKNQEILDRYRKIARESYRRTQTSNSKLQEQVETALQTKDKKKLIKTIQEIEDPQVLRIFKDIEKKEAQPRDDILDVIDKRLKDVYIQILKSVEKSSVSIKDYNPKTGTYNPSNRSYSVVEEEQELVEFQVGVPVQE